jgi:tetratricopeptide (TPR) repeat protein
VAAAALQLAVDLGDPKLVSMCNATLGEAHLARGELDEAHRTFELARRDAEQCGACAEELRALIGLSAADLRCDRRSGARRRAEQARVLAVRQGAGSGPVLAAALIALANVASADERHAEAASLYRDALAAQQEHDGCPTL